MLTALGPGSPWENTADPHLSFFFRFVSFSFYSDIAEIALCSG